jgi:signal transduction histidine kinase
MIEWLNGDGKHWMALLAAVASSVLGFFLALRSPRNIFSTLMFLFMVCVAEWNVFEFLARFTGEKRWPTNLSFVGISFLIALVFHFSVSFLDSRRVRILAVLPVYAVALSFAAVPIAGLLDGKAYDWFYDPRYNQVLLAVLGPVLGCSLVLMLHRALTGSTALRGVHSGFLWAGLVAAPLGAADLAKGANLPGARVGNVGILAACGILFYVAMRHRQVFDLLARSRAEARTLFAETRHGLVTIDTAGRVVDSNDAVVDLLGAEPGTLADIDPGLPELAKAGGQRFVLRSGRVLKATLVAGRSAAGGKPRSHVVLEDATREYELLHELAQRESLASLGEAAATLAHEIRNPLTAIGVTVESLTRGTAGGEPGLERIRSEVRRLDDMLGRSLSLARPIVPDRQATELDRLVLRTLETSGLGDRVTYRAGEGTPRVQLDPELIRQVIVNLVKNAHEAGARTVSIETASDEETVRILVRNDGPAIPPDVLGRLFQPFVTTRATGTGLGLALCRKILHAHGGEITARNMSPGVEFEVSLPWTS